MARYENLTCFLFLVVSEVGVVVMQFLLLMVLDVCYPIGNWGGSQTMAFVEKDI